MLAIVACGREATTPASTRHSPLDGAQQLVVGVIDGWDATDATLARFDRDGDGAWTARGGPWSAVIGKSGAAWGRGLHGDGSAGDAGPIKREGDGRSPAGVFAIVASYGYGDHAVEGARLPYHALGAGWRCVDDPASSHYNRVLDSTGVTIDWSSAETMRRDDALYTWVIELAHNHAAPAAGAGSCIFFHVWSGPGSSTAGCTAMPQPAIEAMLARLDPARRPVYVLLPRNIYTARAAAWGLPPIPTSGVQ